MKLFLLIVLFTSQMSKSMSCDSHDYLKVKFVDELARNGRFRWKSLTVLLDDANDICNSRWISDLNIPRVILSLSSEYSNYPKTFTDAYLVITNKETFTVMEDLISYLHDLKKLDTTKTFIIFSNDMEQPFRLTSLDQIVVQEQFNWNPNTGMVDKPILKFHRYRLLSNLKASEMNGFYDGITLDVASKQVLFDRSFSYQDKKVKVMTFHLPPTTIECKQDKEQFCGRDPNLIRVMGQALHFQPVFLTPNPEEVKWGNKLENGTWTGLIGEVSRGTVTLGVANVFTSQHYMEQVDVSYPYATSCSTFLTPAPKSWPQLYTLIAPFDISLWMATIFSLFVGGLIIQLMALVYHWLFGSRDPLRFFGEAMLYNAQSITGVRSGSDERSAWPIRWYNSVWWLFCFLIGTIYRTGLTSWLASSPIMMPPVDTIAQLVQSNLKPFGFSTFVRDLAEYSSDPHTIDLGRRLEVVPLNMSIQNLMGEHDSNALYENQAFLKYLSVTILPSTMKNKSIPHVDPRQRLHVMRECLQTFPVAIAMTPGAPFKWHMTQIINRLDAAGLIQYWLDSDVLEEKVLTKRSKHESDKEPFSLYCLEGAFYLLLLCYLIDVFAFIAELIFYRISCRRRPQPTNSF